MYKTINNIILLITLFLAIPLQAQTGLGSQMSDWEIYSDDYGHYLGLKKVEMKMIKIHHYSTIPTISKVEKNPKAPGIAIIHYLAGASGTSVIIIRHRAVLYDYINQKFIGEAPVKYETDAEMKQPIWTYQKNQIIVKDQYEGTLSFSY